VPKLWPHRRNHPTHTSMPPSCLHILLAQRNLLIPGMAHPVQHHPAQLFHIHPLGPGLSSLLLFGLTSMPTCSTVPRLYRGFFGFMVGQISPLWENSKQPICLPHPHSSTWPIHGQPIYANTSFRLPIPCDLTTTIMSFPFWRPIKLPPSRLPSGLNLNKAPKTSSLVTTFIVFPCWIMKALPLPRSLPSLTRSTTLAHHNPKCPSLGPQTATV